MTDLETIRRVKGERLHEGEIMGIVLFVTALLGALGLQWFFYGGSR